MSEIFALYLKAGIFGSVIILLILLLRLFLRNAPRRVLCLLWLLAAIRLLVPFQFESRLSLQPDLDTAVDIVLQEQEPLSNNIPTADMAVSAPVIDTDVPQPDSIASNAGSAEVQSPIAPMTVLSIIWLSVAGTAVVYMIVSYGLLKFRVREAVRSDDGVMECDKIRGAFLLGYLKPKIYLPFNVKKRDRRFIIAHERAHIARGDNWWKLLGFICAGLHWYNPLVWLAYVLLCRDIEMACDERVIRELNTEDRKAYSLALLNCGKSLSGVSVCPVAFGEVSLKTRIKKVLTYRRPGLWITVIAAAMVIITAVCFLTSPVAEAIVQEITPEQTHLTTDAATTETEPSVETQPATVPVQTDHQCNYNVTTVEPTCTDDGYDLYTCACGRQKAENYVKAKGHEYILANSEDTNATFMRYKCVNCSYEYWEKVDQSASGTGSVQSQLEAYAASLGFDMNFTASRRNAKRFAYSTLSYMDSNMLLVTGKSLIRDAYQYCIDNDLDISKQMCCILLDLPSYSNDPLFDPLTFNPNNFGNTNGYNVYVYVAPVVTAETSQVPTLPELDLDNILNTETTEPTENTDSTNPTETTEVTEPTEETEPAEPTEEYDDSEQLPIF